MLCRGVAKKRVCGDSAYSESDKPSYVFSSLITETTKARNRDLYVAFGLSWYNVQIMKNDLLTKEEIAAELSPPPDEPLSIRSVERYIHLAGVVPVVKGSGRGKQAKFRREDVDKITSAYRAASERRENQSTALTTTKHATDFRVARVAEIVMAVDELRAKVQPQADVGAKIMLTLADAAALSSLSENHLREAIKAKKLKGRIIGRGYKIKRVDLDAYIKKL